MCGCKCDFVYMHLSVPSIARVYVAIVLPADKLLDFAASGGILFKIMLTAYIVLVCLQLGFHPLPPPSHLRRLPPADPPPPPIFRFFVCFLLLSPFCCLVLDLSAGFTHAPHALVLADATATALHTIASHSLMLIDATFLAGFTPAPHALVLADAAAATFYTLAPQSGGPHNNHPTAVLARA